MMEIQPQIVNLNDLFSGRLFRIPQYQRAYSWGSKQRKDLFEDIKKSYAASGRNHFMDTIVGMRRETAITIYANQYQAVEIVDGQQRITTLILLLKAISLDLDSDDMIEGKIRDSIEETLMKPDKVTLLLLQTNHDTSGHFMKYVLYGKYPQPEIAKTFADRQLLSAMKECEDFVSQWQKDGHPLTDLIGHLKNRLTFIFHEIGDESLVYSVFEVLNSRGLPVSWFDRLKSMLMAIVFDDSEIGDKEGTIKQVHSIWAEIYGTVGLSLNLSVEALRFAATLRSHKRPNRALGAEASVNLLLSQSQKAHEVIKTSNWIISVTKAVDAIVSDRRRNAVTHIAHARLFAVAVELRKDIGEDDKREILRLWENVTFRIFGIYGKDARTAVGDYVRLAWNTWKGGWAVEQILFELHRIGSKFPSNEDDIAIELAEVNAYGDRFNLEELRYFFHRYEEHLAKEAGLNFCNQHWNHIWQASATDSIEHILPQSSEEECIHWLGNLTMLPPKLNSKLQDIPPVEKSASYTKTGLLDAQDVAGRINKEGKWSKKGILEREKKLLTWAAQEWSD